MLRRKLEREEDETWGVVTRRETERWSLVAADPTASDRQTATRDRLSLLIRINAFASHRDPRLTPSLSLRAFAIICLVSYSVFISITTYLKSGLRTVALLRLPSIRMCLSARSGLSTVRFTLAARHLFRGMLCCGESRGDDACGEERACDGVFWWLRRDLLMTDVTGLLSREMVVEVSVVCRNG